MASWEASWNPVRDRFRFKETVRSPRTVDITDLDADDPQRRGGGIGPDLGSSGDRDDGLFSETNRPVFPQWTVH